MDNFIAELASLNILDKLAKGPNIDPNHNYELVANAANKICQRKTHSRG